MIDSSGLGCNLRGKLLFSVALLFKSFYLFSRGSKITLFYREEGTTGIPRKIFKTLCAFSKVIFQEHIHCTECTWWHGHFPQGFSGKHQVITSWLCFWPVIQLRLWLLLCLTPTCTCRTIPTLSVFPFGHVSRVFKVGKWRRFRQLLHPGDANGQDAVALQS